MMNDENEIGDIRRFFRKHGSNIGMSALIVLVFAFIFTAIPYYMRYMSAKTVIQRVVSPRPGIECYETITSDGISTYCWEVAELPDWDGAKDIPEKTKK